MFVVKHSDVTTCFDRFNYTEAEFKQVAAATVVEPKRGSFFIFLIRFFQSILVSINLSCFSTRNLIFSWNTVSCTIYET